MPNVTRKELMPGVSLTAVHSQKFKTCMLGVFLLTPMSAQYASANALIPAVLCRGTERHPDMESINAALDELYGGSIDPVVLKMGECQCIGLTGSFLDDAYALDGGAILEPAAKLMGELLFRPVTENGVFRASYTMGEKQNLIDDIRAAINEKRAYSVQKLVEIMCAGEAYGVARLGTEEAAGDITPESLWERYRTLLRTARVEVYYCGSTPPERAEDIVRSALAELPGGTGRELPTCMVVKEAERVRDAEEQMDVTQGKLAMGFRTGGVTVDSADYPAMMLFNAVYGGTTTSKLFMNVREKLSLCYFASSMLDGRKGVMVVSSGIEFEKYQQAKDEILAQLDACRKGEIEDWELEGARRSVVSSLEVTADNQGRQQTYWLGQALNDSVETPEELAARVEAVTKEDVMAAAKKLTLDTSYFLKGMEG